MCYNKCILKLKNLGVSIENHAKDLQVDVEHLQKKSRKPCKSDQYRNRSTGRCQKKASPTIKTTKTYKNISPKRKLTSTKYIQIKSGLLKTPKKIHALWLNFKENKDGVIPDNLHVFIDRMKNLHQTWDIKIWTSWEINCCF